MTYLILWAILGFITFIGYIGWTNLDRPRWQIFIWLLCCGPFTQLALLGVGILHFLEECSKGIYSIRCAYEQWKKVRVL